MKSMIAMLCLAIPLVLTAAGPSAEEMAFYKAYKNGAQAKKCLRVVDQDGMPTVGALVTAPRLCTTQRLSMWWLKCFWDATASHKSAEGRSKHCKTASSHCG